MKSLEEVKKMYKLPEEEHEKIGNQIKQIFLYDKFPVERPKAIINIAPPASGKTGLNGFSAEQFTNNNVVIINSDELKPFHPKIDEIAKLYPQYYTKVTDQESNTWTSGLFDAALAGKYNVIFEGTGRNARILETIRNKMPGYEVIVRGMAVNELNCLISILERYEGQMETKGWGRLVTMDHFYETYRAMPETIDAIEKSGIVASSQIFKRGKTPTRPVIIYNSSDRENGRFPNAKFAVLGGRKEDEKQAVAYYEIIRDKLLKSTERENISEEECTIIERIEELYKIHGELMENKKKTIIR